MPLVSARGFKIKIKEMNSKLTQIAAETLRRYHNEEYRECERITTPLLTDLAHFDELLKFIESNVERNPENSHFIISLVYFVYCPFKLYYQEVRMQNGIREALCRLMNWKDSPVVNYYSNISIAYWKNPRFRTRVEEMANQFLETLST